MATSNGQRVAAFFLAALFLLSTVGATAYVLWQINQDDGVLVNESAEEKAAADELAKAQAAAADGSQACGQGQIAAGQPRALPAVVTNKGAITELKTVDVAVGEGEEVQPGDCVAALYYGTLATSGEKFDGNYETGQPIEFSLNGVIAGWAEGIPGMRVGSVRRLLVPAELGYGEQGSQGVIPPNADLIFEVEITATRRGI